MLSTENSTRRASGFGLVEVMVGMVIGLLGIIIMMQVSTIFGAQKRSTTGGNDALSSGAIVMYNLQSEIGRAGYGFSNYSLMGCTVSLNLINPAFALNSVTIAPVTINHPSIPLGDAYTDTLLIMYTNSNKQTKGIHISGTSGVGNFQVQDAQDFAPNELVLAQQNASPTCPIPLIMGGVASSGVVNNVQTTIPPVTPPISDGNLYNLGQKSDIVIEAYAIRNSQLQRCDLMSSDCSILGSWVSIADNIVSLKAQYGVDTDFTSPKSSATYVVKSYSNSPNPVAAPPPQPAAGCTWARIPAVRIALVARNSQLEKTKGTANNPDCVTPIAPIWAGGPAASMVLGTDVCSITTTNWHNYRYQVFEDTIPLRNVIWLKVQSASSVPPVSPPC